jgi:hypothetical protein
MMAIAALGIELGKNGCSVAGLNRMGRVALQRRITRDGVVKLGAKLPACTMAMVHFADISCLPLRQ